MKPPRLGFIALVPLAMLAGFLAALLAPSARASHVTDWFYVTPPVLGDGGWAYLTKGWHAAYQGAPSIALDFEDGNVAPNTMPLYFRGFGYNNEGPSDSYDMYYFAWDKGIENKCYAVSVDLYGNFGIGFVGAVGWYHANSADNTIVYFAFNWNGRFNSAQVATGRATARTVGQEAPNCPWTETHVHEWNWPVTGGPWVINAWGYPSEPAQQCCNINNIVNYWTRYTSWTR